MTGSHVPTQSELCPPVLMPELEYHLEEDDLLVEEDDLLVEEDDLLVEEDDRVHQRVLVADPEDVKDDGTACAQGFAPMVNNCINNRIKHYERITSIYFIATVFQS
ncbi:uncharacterized protein LOC142767343 isoform X2 [Rhipicephalus microplus]|uniref:uncharacterized protein LOC142767343 isoform X2 n=1 Tax=Rhipicephalus microplus TaxID=6941 RepID=UPI003F6B4375